MDDAPNIRYTGPMTTIWRAFLRGFGFTHGRLLARMMWGR